MATEETPERATGTVKWFNSTKGFGFIESGTDGTELFVHQSNILAEGFRSLREGEPVEFDVEVGPDGKQKAINVTGPEGAPPQGAGQREVSYAAPYPRADTHYRNVTPPAGYAAGPPTYPGYPAAPSGAAFRGGRGGVRPGSQYWEMDPSQSYGYGPGPQAYSYAPGPMPDAYGAYAAWGGRGPPGYRMGFAPGRGYGPARGFSPGRGMYGIPQEFISRPPPPGTPGISSGLQVVVHNLPWDCTWQQLKDAFSSCGQIERADVVFDTRGRSRGFGIVRFPDQAAAEDAVSRMNNQSIGGRTVTVRIDRFA